VLFDLGNTLVSYYRSQDFAPVLRRCVAAASAVLDARAGTARIARDLDVAYRRALECDVERSDHRIWPLGERLRRVFELETTEPETLEALGTAFLAPIFATATLDPSAIPILSQIRWLGIKTAIVSNTPWGSASAAWRAELARHGLLAAVDAAVFCMDVGWRKPARQPFEHALAALGARAERSWFVGDDPVWDVEGARAAGLQPVLIGATPPDGVRGVRSIADLMPLITSLKSAR